jgi:CheY-like chemotaxis protein
MESGPVVYVCDDTAQIRQLIRLNLELDGFEVHEYSDGEALLEGLHAADRLPDAITLDAQMEPRDGWWAIARIREDERLAGIPVVMVTASVHEHDRAQAQGSGLDAFVAKPFEPEELVELVQGLTTDGRGTAGAP